MYLDEEEEFPKNRRRKIYCGVKKILAVTHIYPYEEGGEKSYNYDVLMHTKKDEKAKKAVLIGLDVSGKKTLQKRGEKKEYTKIYERHKCRKKEMPNLRNEINYPTNHSIRRTVFTGFSSS